MKTNKRYKLILESKNGETISTMLNHVNMMPIVFDFLEAMQEGKSNVKKITIEEKGS